MLRMGIALFLTLAFAAYIWFPAEKRYTQPHRTFSALLAAVAELGGARAPHLRRASTSEFSLCLKTNNQCGHYENDATDFCDFNRPFLPTIHRPPHLYRVDDGY